jgi:hypothetical protein
MARGPQHSSNWGGRREGAGGKKPNGPNRMTAKAIQMAEESDMHPYVFLLSVIADPNSSMKDKLFASAACLPYCLSKQATQLIVTNDFEGKSRSELEGRLLSVRQERLALEPAVIEGEVVSVS